MTSGPSKEQLESLFKTSRKYFDELAKDYYAKDRDFYDKNFAPFYNNPFVAAKKGGKPVLLIVAISLSVLIAGASFLIVMLLNTESTENKPVKQSEKYQEPEKKEKDKPAASIKDSIEKDNIKSENMLKEMKQKESEVKENTGKREVRSKPMERTR
jgi:uncharacterized protein HemX